MRLMTALNRNDSQRTFSCPPLHLKRKQLTTAAKTITIFLWNSSEFLHYHLDPQNFFSEL